MLLSYVAWTLMIGLFVAALLSYARRKAHFRPLQKLPGTPPTFLIGNISWVLKLYFRKNLKYHPGVYITDRILGTALLYHRPGLFCFWFGVKPLVSISKAEIVEVILSSSVNIEKSYEYTFLHKWLGTGLLTSTGSKWKVRRRLLTPSFHFRILEDFLPVFNQQSLILVEKLKSLAAAEYVDITPHIILCTLDAICETVMGVSIGAQKGNNSEYVNAIHDLADYFNFRTAQPWLWSDVLFGVTSLGRKFFKDIDKLHSFTDQVIREKKEKLLKRMAEEGEKGAEEVDSLCCGKQRKTFMDLLLDMHVNEQQLSEADIREEVDTFMFEGHDTTAMGIIFALYCIGLYPDVQKKIAEEIDALFGGDTERAVTHDDIRNLKYLECVLKESQRLFPSVPLVGRVLEEDIHYEGYTIPRHTTVHLNLLGLHRHPDVFPNPEVFDPDRFAPDSALGRHPYAYVPFSAGPRNCIGQKFAMLEEKTVVCNVLRHFRIVSLDPRDLFHIKVELTLRPAQEVRLKFVPRK